MALRRRQHTQTVTYCGPMFLSVNVHLKYSGAELINSLYLKQKQHCPLQFGWPCEHQARLLRHAAHASLSSAHLFIFLMNGKLNCVIEKCQIRACTVAGMMAPV